MPAGLAPGLVCLIATPLILYVIYPPEVKDTPDAPEKARWVCPPRCKALLENTWRRLWPFCRSKARAELVASPSAQALNFRNGCLWGLSFV